VLFTVWFDNIILNCRTSNAPRVADAGVGYNEKKLNDGSKWSGFQTYDHLMKYGSLPPLSAKPPPSNRLHSRPAGRYGARFSTQRFTLSRSAIEVRTFARLEALPCV
jgi:hypothetical protein